MFVPIHQSGHFGGQIQKLSRRRASAGNDYVLVSILTRLLRVNTFEHQVVNVSNLPVRQRFMVLHDVFDIQNRIAVVRRFEMLSQRLPTNRDAFEHNLRLSQRQRIPFDSVGVVSPIQHQLFSKRCHAVRW